MFQQLDNLTAVTALYQLDYSKFGYKLHRTNALPLLSKAALCSTAPALSGLCESGAQSVPHNNQVRTLTCTASFLIYCDKDFQA